MKLPNLAKKLYAMKAGDQFAIETAKERSEVCRMAKVLYDSGAIEISIITRRNGKGWKVVAI